MCFSTKKLKFLDIINILAPGHSYDKYLKAYGCELQKGHFPYKYMDGIGKLEDIVLPPQEAFYSRLQNEFISDEDYARCQAVWRDNGMKTMHDFLVWYNNRDVAPFLDAIDKQFAFYKQQNIDMFKDGVSVPGLTLLYLFNELPSITFFTVVNQTNSDMHLLVKYNIVGGPAIIFHRYHEKDITKIRGEETCRSIVGYDANALYLWALMQDMPTGWYTRRREERQFRPQQAQPFEQMAVQWLHKNEHWRLVEDRNGQVGYAPAAFLVVILDTAEEEEDSDATKKGLENGTEENRIGQEGERRKSYSAAVIDGIKRKSRIFVGDSIVRKTDTRLSKEEDVVVCLPGARIEHVTERVEKIMGRGKGGTILVHIGTNNADKEGTTTIVDKYRKLLKKTKEARVEQIILSGILPVFGNRIDGYRNSKRMAINGMVKRLCKEEDVGYVDLWDSVVGKEGMYARDGLHLSGKGAAVFAEGLSGAVASGLGKVRYLN